MVERGKVPTDSPYSYSYKFPRDDREPWVGRRPWLEISKEAAHWKYAGYFTTVTTVDNPSNFYLMDIYIHGHDPNNGPLLKVTNIDLRKFFPDPIKNRNSCIARAQNYLGEYNRKSRAYYTHDSTTARRDVQRQSARSHQ